MVNNSFVRRRFGCLFSPTGAEEWPASGSGGRYGGNHVCGTLRGS